MQFEVRTNTNSLSPFSSTKHCYCSKAVRKLSNHINMLRQSNQKAVRIIFIKFLTMELMKTLA